MVEPAGAVTVMLRASSKLALMDRAPLPGAVSAELLVIVRGLNLPALSPMGVKVALTVSPSTKMPEVWVVPQLVEVPISALRFMPSAPTTW